MIQKDAALEFRQSSLATRERILAIVSGLSPGQLSERPEPAGWTIGDVLEHLCISTEYPLAGARKAVASARIDAASGSHEWKPSFIGNLIASSLKKPRKIKAPKVFAPPASPRGGVVEAWRALDGEMIQLLDDAQSINWRSTKVLSAAFPPWMPKYNLGDVFKIHAVHNERHFAQVKRLSKAITRPGGV